jgi:phospholipid/cholesterol/gamma-HCH transport system substrate-binding protein
MNERVMQFRIGMFVIVAGLVLTMLVIWFGESPALFRRQKFVIAHYPEAPGVSEGIPIRKSGIRIGEVVSIRFDDRPGQPDGVLVTLAFDPKFQIREGSIPRVSRAIIGDVSIDMMPGTGDQLMEMGDRAASAPIIEGAVAPDPANALAAATDAFQNVKGTLLSIDEAAKGLSGIAKKAENLDEFLASFRDMGKKVGVLADDLDKMAKSADSDFPAMVSNVRQISDKINSTFDEKTLSDLKNTTKQLSSGSTRLDQILSDVTPLAKDLGLDPGKPATTSLGQALNRFNRISYDLGLLTSKIGDGRGGLNPNGSLQRMLTDAQLYDNFNKLASSGREVMSGAKTVLANFNRFAERVANDPGAIGRGALQR